MQSSAPARQSFWDFSLSVYAEEAVKSSCLELQDKGLNVNLSLWIVWTCLYGRDPRAALGQAIEQCALFNTQIVQPLRQARSNLKRPPDFVTAEAAEALRQSILARELDAERIEQSYLEALAHICPEHEAAETVSTLIQESITAYLQRLGLRVETATFIENVLKASKIVY